MNDKLITLNDAAKYLRFKCGLSVARMAKRGKAPFMVKVGGQWRTKVKWIEDWLTKKGSGKC